MTASAKRRTYTVEEWAELYQLNVETVRRQIRTGRIVAVNVGKGRPVYRITDAERERYNRANASAA